MMAFLGHEPAYWDELERRMQTEHGLRASELLEEVCLLRAKVSFYESRISEMFELTKRPLR